ncbi:trace amine-associated receptor 13c-like [Anabas testudineus]|uniref:trace amine-associated receptor 13c-like n=1 Tax=Anabas testudineus TaxID=64144 RepID=UPI000E460D58|nr:trace amine-associated receptor 13c-like [Anabas testudineus]
MEEAELCFPELNTSCSKTLRPRSKLFSSLLSFVTFLIVVLNLLVIISISHFRQLHTNTNLLVFSLAVTDFLVGLLQMPTEILLYQGCWILGDLLCVVNFFFGAFLISVSVGNMVLISVDRYVAICDPMSYSTKVTLNRVQICICLCWLFSALHSCWTVRNIFNQQDRYDLCYGECIIEYQLTEVAFYTAVTFLGPITVITLLYLRVFVVAVSQARAMRSHVAAVADKHSGTVKPKKSEMKAARTLGVVIFVFLLCYSPLCIITIEVGLSSTLELPMWVVYCNSGVNPLIYALFYPWFRKSIKQIVTLQILQPDSCDANIL